MICSAEPVMVHDEPRPAWVKDEHIVWRDKLRAFVEAKITPHVAEWDEAGDFPAACLRKELYDQGIYAALYPESLGGTPPPGLTTQADVPFFDMIMWDEFARCGSGGVISTLFGGTSIGLPPLLKHGSEYLKNAVAIPSIKGVATMALCVTEPEGGSDVAGLKTTAVWHPEQQCFVVNGQKKWITNGCKADYLTVVCRVEPHHDLATHGMSLLLIKRSLWSASKSHEDTRMAVFQYCIY